ncbi:MAG: pyridoxamine 5'-phosphate oxidase family protein [Dehalococcoidia bacterium]|nr:pyridoxamine 5'-phosphate oxidase family protein [Dehalococcoidia bacterium]
MADWYDSIDAGRRAFIERQHLFFVATAGDGPDGTVNLSPKGRALCRVLGPNLVGWLDYPGSGNETANHTATNGRITVMFCSFETATGILRLYGRGRALALDAAEFAPHREAFRDDVHPFVRQAFLVDVERVQTSCGYAVPRMEFVAERDTLDRWCENRLQPRGIASDGFPTPGPLLRKDGTPL